MERNTREAVRYLGYGNHVPDDRTMQLIQTTFQELEHIANPKSIYRVFALSFLDTDVFIIGNMKVQSKNLYKNLTGCQKAVVFGATLGTGVDMLMKRLSLTDMAKACVLQACAAAMLEEYCDEIQRAIAIRLEKEHLYLRPRFSPGYGDYSIYHQDDILRMLDAPKQIGLTMTDGYMLVPSKSVTAVIGAGATKEPCHIKGCEMCGKSDCKYRRS